MLFIVVFKAVLGSMPKGPRIRKNVKNKAKKMIVKFCKLVLIGFKTSTAEVIKK